MTEEQTKILNQLLDKNHELTQARNLYNQLQVEVAALDEELMRAMGKEAYTKFMSMGKRMFS